MSLSIVVLLLFQLFWLSKEYRQQREILQKETSNIFLATVRELQDSMIRRTILMPIESKHSDSTRRGGLFLFESNTAPGMDSFPLTKTTKNIFLRKNIPTSLTKDSSNIAFSTRNIQIQLSGDSAKGLMHLQEDMLESVVLTVRAVGASQEVLINGAHPDSAVITLKPDSLRLDSIAENFALALQHTGIDLPFRIQRLEEPDSLIQWNGLITGTAKGDFTLRSSYLAQFPHYKWYVFKKILPQVLFSLFLISITTFSFWLIYRNLQQQRRLTALKNDFISNVTHELKTPITTVSVAIEALSNFNALQSPERTEEYLQISKNELSRLSLLVDKVLRMSIFEKQEPELKLETFDLKELVQEILNSMKLQFERFTANVQFHWSENDYTLEGDRLHLMSVIYNLIDNALKYSQKEPNIAIDLKTLNANIAITVSDNGMGIPLEYQTKIFDKFFRVPTGDRHNIKGHGLGLSYVSSVIRQHNGQIQLESKLGRGSSFTVQLPKQQTT